MSDSTRSVYASVLSPVAIGCMMMVLSAGCITKHTFLCADVHCPDGYQCIESGADAVCAPTDCGNGMPEEGEVCDDGNNTSGDGCSADCQSTEICGNEILDEAAGEECDDGEQTATCEQSCRMPVCGDHQLNRLAGEACDDGNHIEWDSCSNACLIRSSIVAGGEHTCKLAKDGKVHCWGNGAEGRLGYGNTDSIGKDQNPSEFSAVDVVGQVTQLTAGDAHTCALLGNSGAVQCWGRGAEGQLGYGSIDNVGDRRSPQSAGVVNVGGNVTEIAAGHNHACAVLEGGTVRCWGKGADGQLGYGRKGNVGDDESPATAGDIDVGGLVRQVAAGSDHTCALLEGGAVRCWGRAGLGQLGYDDTEENIGDNESPAAAGDVEVGKAAVQVVAGGDHTCALVADGTARCWGAGFSGLSGGGAAGLVEDTVTVAGVGGALIVNVDFGGRILRLTAGDGHTCALLEGGAVRCLGNGESGQLGYGDTDPIGGDETPGDVDVGGEVVEVVAGGSHTCAVLASGAVRCWGLGASGQLGYGNEDSIGDDELPASAGDVDVEPDVVQVAAGALHTCALLERGVVRCWGAGGDGQLGYLCTEDIGDNEVPATAGDVTVGGTVVQIAAGEKHTCAMLADGAVRCWGQGEKGRLGYGNTEDVGNGTPLAIAGDVAVGGTVVQIAAGEEHTCALLDGGAVRCWGEAERGQLGYGNTEDVGDDETPVTAGNVDAGGTVVQIVTGAWHTCALLKDGAVRCWGRGDEGQLGYGNTADIGDDETPAMVGNVEVGGTVVKLAAGGFHTCALLQDGGVKCWGNGREGRLGHGNTTNIGDNETPASIAEVAVGGLAVQLTAGEEHTCALLEGGAVRCWGRGALGRLGYGNTTNIGDDETPDTVGDVNVGGTAVQLSAGGFHTCALLAGGAVRCWGAGARGRLGYGNARDIGDTETPDTVGPVVVVEQPSP